MVVRAKKGHIMDALDDYWCREQCFRWAHARSKYVVSGAYVHLPDL